MKYEEVLLIGGSKDGVRMSVIKGVSSIRVPTMQDTPAQIGGNAVDALTTFEVAEYRRVAMSGDDGFKGCVYVIDGVEPMSALIKGYRKP